MIDNIMSISRRDFQEDMKLCASTDFCLNSKEKPVKYVFFNDIDDVMDIVKNNEDEGEVNVVSNRSLNSVYCDFKRAKYEPNIIMGAWNRTVEPWNRGTEPWNRGTVKPWNRTVEPWNRETVEPNRGTVEP